MQGIIIHNICNEFSFVAKDEKTQNTGAGTSYLFLSSSRRLEERKAIAPLSMYVIG